MIGVIGKEVRHISTSLAARFKMKMFWTDCRWRFFKVRYLKRSKIVVFSATASLWLVSSVRYSSALYYSSASKFDTRSSCITTANNFLFSTEDGKRKKYTVHLKTVFCILCYPSHFPLSKVWQNVSWPRSRSRSTWEFAEPLRFHEAICFLPNWTGMLSNIPFNTMVMLESTELTVKKDCCK